MDKLDFSPAAYDLPEGRSSSVASVIGKRKRRKQARREELKEKKLAAKKIKLDTSFAAVETNAAVSSEVLEERKARKLLKVKAFEASCQNNFAVVVDCAWEDFHSERDLNSLSQQIMFCYSLNKKSTNPTQLFLTGVGERLRNQLCKVEANHWMGVTIDSKEFTDIGLTKQLVYLTSDADETLEFLDPDSAYVIGGIVDRNRLKGITHRKATEQGIKTAKLPIKEYCTIKSTPVLTVNHVFDILLSFSKCGSWGDAFKSILPQRKEVSSKATSEGYVALICSNEIETDNK